MHKSSNNFETHEILSENRENLYPSRYVKKRKVGGEQKVFDAYQYDVDEYQNNPQAYFTRIEHWSLDGG